MSCVALAATLALVLSFFPELLQQRGLSLWDTRFLRPDQDKCIHLWVLPLPGHLLHYGSKASTETPRFLSGNRTPSAWKAVLLLHMFSSEMVFSVASENTATSLNSLPFVFTLTLLEVGITWWPLGLFAVFFLIFLLSKFCSVPSSFWAKVKGPKISKLIFEHTFSAYCLIISQLRSACRESLRSAV